MIPHDLIEDIFARPQAGGSTHTRHVTKRQLDCLRSLIEEDAERGALSRVTPGLEVWRPAGGTTYSLIEDARRDRYMLTRSKSVDLGGMGSLF